MTNTFNGLLKSEIKKVEKCANDFLDCNDCKVTGYSYGGIDELGFVSVTCEICHNYDTRSDCDINLNVFMPDRRRSFAVVKVW